MNETLKKWIETCIAEYEKEKGVMLSATEKELFFYAFDEGMKTGEDFGFLL